MTCFNRWMSFRLFKWNGRLLTSGLLTFLLGMILIGGLSCGKVVQQVAKDEQVPSFDVVFTVGPVSTMNRRAKLTAFRKIKPENRRQLHVDHDGVYANLVGVASTGKFESLSWGKAVLAKEKPAEQELQSQDQLSVVKELTYASTAFRKDGIKLTGASDHTWTKLVYENKPRQWKVNSNKIKRAYPLYLASFFVDKDHYYFRVVDEKTVSQNKTINLGMVTDYDTFLGVMMLVSVQSGVGLSDLQALYEDVSLMFGVDFFDAFQYEFPLNKTKKFVPTIPSFVLSGSIEKELLKWIQLKRDDPKEAMRYISGFKAAWMPKKAQKIVVKHIENAMMGSQSEGSSS